MTMPLHDYRLNRDSVTVVVVHPDQYTPELLARYPQAAELPLLYQVITPNGQAVYVLDADTLLQVIELAGQGRGVLRRVIDGLERSQALSQGRADWRRWTQRFIPRTAQLKSKAGGTDVLAALTEDEVLIDDD